MLKVYRFFVLFVAGLLFFIFSYSQDLNKIISSDVIPFYPGVKKTILPNGFTYYTASTTIQPGKIYIRLNIRAGAYQQDKDQPEVAHVVEHLVMRSSLHFPENNSLKQYLKSSGITNYNAYPETEYTAYYFEIPADTVVLEKLCLAFQDWLSGRATFTNETVVAEKKIVLAESRERGKVDYFNTLCSLLQPSRFYETYEVKTRFDFSDKVANLSPKVIQKFYEDWYRPNLGGLIVIGDVDTSAVERIVSRKFAELKNPITQRPHISYPIELNGNNKYIIDVNTSEENIFSIHQYFLKEYLTPTTYSDYRKSILIEIFNKMMNHRLNDLCKNHKESSPGPVHVRFGRGLYGLASLNIQALLFSINCDHSTSIIPGLKKLLREAERIRRYGFNQQELSLASSELLLLPFRSETERLSVQAQLYTDHYVYGEIIPIDPLRSQLRKQFLVAITLKEINELARSWITEENTRLVIRAPKDSGSNFPSESQVVNWLKEIQQAPLSPYEFRKQTKIKSEKVNFDSLYRLHSPARYTRHDFKETGITQLRLSNGVKIIIKSAVSSSSKKIYVQGIRPIGAAGYNDANYFSARLAPAIVLEAGLGELNKEKLDNFIQQHDLKLSADIGDDKTTLWGNAPSEEFEALLQVIYRHFLVPKKDSAAYALGMSKLRQAANPKRDFVSSELSPLVGYRLKPMSNLNLSKNETNKIEYLRCIESYKSCFSVPKDFTFVITGCHDLERTVAMVAKYLGNLPVVKHNSPPTIAFSAKNIPFNLHKTVINKNLEKQSAEVFLFYSRYQQCSVKEIIKQHLLAKILESACIERLREKEAGIYSLYAEVIILKMHRYRNQSLSEFKIVFKCERTISEKLIKAAREEVEMLKDRGASREDFNQAIQQYKKIWLTINLDDITWHKRLFDFHYNNESFANLLKLDSLINAISPEDIRQAAQIYLDKNHFISYTEIPATNEEIQINQ